MSKLQTAAHGGSWDEFHEHAFSGALQQITASPKLQASFRCQSNNTHEHWFHTSRRETEQTSERNENRGKTGCTLE